MRALPLPHHSVPMNKWTVLCFDMPAIMEAVTRGEYPAEDYACLKSIMLCSSMTVRNVYTSDILYSPEVLHAAPCSRLHASDC